MKYIEKNTLFYALQSGFRPKHSCHTALARLHNTWLDAINNRHMVGAVYLDLRKAFDLVDHSVLIEKLKLYLQNTASTDFFSSYLSQRQQSVLVHGSYSALKDVKCGVPQGSILGPVLFGLYINDLPLSITDEDATLELFADDSTLHTQSNCFSKIQQTLQISLNDINNWCTENRMVLHPQKSKSMLVTTRQKRQLRKRLKQPLTLNLKIENTEIDQVEEHRLLGVIFNEDLSWQPHIEHISKRISRNLYLMRKLKDLVTADALKSFFHAHCISYINYSSTVWFRASENHIKALESLYKRGIKILNNDPNITTSQKCKHLDLLSLYNQFAYNASTLMYKVFIGEAPEYLRGFFERSHKENRHPNYILPKPRIDLYKEGLAFWGSSVWKSLPLECKLSLLSNGEFVMSLNTH